VNITQAAFLTGSFAVLTSISVGITMMRDSNTNPSSDSQSQPLRYSLQPAVETPAPAEAVEPQTYTLEDSYNVCLQRLSKDFPGRLTDIQENNQQSRYNRESNTNSITVSLMVHPTAKRHFTPDSYKATVLCQTSAATNKITHFRMSELEGDPLPPSG